MKQRNGLDEGTHRYETGRTSAAIRFSFVSLWRKSQQALGRTERKGQIFVQEAQCNKTLPMLMLQAVSRRLHDWLRDISSPCSSNVSKRSIGEMRTKYTRNLSPKPKGGRPFGDQGVERKIKIGLKEMVSTACNGLYRTQLPWDAVHLQYLQTTVMRIWEWSHCFMETVLTHNLP